MLKFVNFIENSTGKDAVVLLFGQIGYDFDGNEFAKELEELSNIPGLNSCKIKINSIGGNVYQGMSILSAIDILKEKNIPIHTECVGVAYSMAGVILVCGKKRSIVNYGTVMMHDPKFAFGDDLTEPQKNMLQKMTDSLSMIIKNNTAMPHDMVRDYMSKETTFNAEECVNHGIVDEIIQTGRKLEPISNHYDLMVACSDIYNNKPITKKMSKLTDLLKLNDAASEEAIVSAVNGLMTVKSDIQALADEKKALENQVTLLKSENATLKEQAMKSTAEALVNKAVEEGKISEKGKDLWITNAMKDYEGTKNLIEGLSVVPADINSQLETNKTEAKNLVEKYEKLLDSPSEMDKVDPKELQAMEEAWTKSQKLTFSVLN